ncbi:hypothetical protein HanPSC8_Chr14g0618451 [Helianthus annuus]|nr:hypothetical protein HanIR_Chr14g0699211 [Helianthus annuus]KAJ0840418.1 hypothetical protein HanPSC8_Chr14g0618451 [Helianthus annuus]
MIISPVDESVHIFTLGPVAGNFCWCQHGIVEDHIFIVREPTGQVLYFHMDNFMCCCQKGYHAKIQRYFRRDGVHTSNIVYREVLRDNELHMYQYLKIYIFFRFCLLNFCIQKTVCDLKLIT